MKSFITKARMYVHQTSSLSSRKIFLLNTPVRQPRSPVSSLTLTSESLKNAQKDVKHDSCQPTDWGSGYHV